MKIFEDLQDKGYSLSRDESYRSPSLDPYSVEITGKIGKVYLYSESKGLLAAYCHDKTARAALRKLGKVHQRGDEETVILFPATVAASIPVLRTLMAPRKRRGLRNA